LEYSNNIKNEGLEEILVIPSLEINDILPFSNKLIKNIEIQDFCNSICQKIQVISKGSADHHPEFRQFVTYSIIKIDNNFYMTLLRKPDSWEERLHNKLTIGIGGHVNSSSCDSTNNQQLFEIIYRSMWREIDEEVNIRKVANLKKEIFLGLLNNDAETDREHIGFVWNLDFACKNIGSIICKEHKLSDLSLFNPEDLKERFNKFESWSQILLKDII